MPSCCWMSTSRKNPVPRNCISTTVVQIAPATVATLTEKREKSLTRVSCVCRASMRGIDRVRKAAAVNTRLRAIC